MNIKIGTAPDAWGVWFPDDPKQISAIRFLDEVVEAGFEWIELGPYGLPAHQAVQAAQRTGSARLEGVRLRRGGQS